MNEPYPWHQKYTHALNTGVRIGKVILLAAATTRATLRRAHNAPVGFLNGGNGCVSVKG